MTKSFSKTKVIVETYSVSSLICTLGVTKEIALVNWCGTFSANKQQTEGNFQLTRDNRFDIQIEYAKQLARICGAEFSVRYDSKIAFSPNCNYIVDINAVRESQIYPEETRIQFLASTPETITPLLGLSQLVGLGSLRSRFACLRDFYLKKRINRALSPVKASRLADFCLKVSQLNLELLHENVKYVAQEFARGAVNSEFSKIFYKFIAHRNLKILVILPLPAHYGGNAIDDIYMAHFVRDTYPLEDYFILVKNHPSDKEFHQDFKEVLGGKNFHYWHDLYERNLPIELISISFMNRVTLLSTGSTAMYTINPESSIIFWPSNHYARKLARINYASSANHLGIRQKYIDERFIHAN